MVLYDDILLLVLPLLPPKTSARFKSVCRCWNLLISGCSYLQSLHKCCMDCKHINGFYHGSRARERLQFGLIKYEDSERAAHALTFKLLDENNNNCHAYEICATCNGFFLFENPAELILQNPSLKVNVRIAPPPQPPSLSNSTYLNYFGLVVSSSSSSSWLECATELIQLNSSMETPPSEIPGLTWLLSSFGLDGSSLLSPPAWEQQGNNKPAFMIMSIIIGRKVDSCLCFIYSSLSESWMPVAMDDMVLKQLSSPQEAVYKRQYGYLDPYPILNPVGATFLRQSLHWLFDDGRIFAFDLKEQTWRYMETPAARGELRLIKNYSDIFYAAVKSFPYSPLVHKLEAEHKLSCYWYPNTWLGSMGEHIYMLVVVDETNLQLWILDNYDEVDWKIIVDIKNCGFIAPLFFDGRRIFVAAFDFEEWKNKKGVIRFFDIFTRKWLPNNFIITEDISKVRFFFAMTSPSSETEVN